MVSFVDGSIKKQLNSHWHEPTVEPGVAKEQITLDERAQSLACAI